MEWLPSCEMIHARFERDWIRTTLVEDAHRNLSPYLPGRFPMFSTFGLGATLRIPRLGMLAGWTGRRRDHGPMTMLLERQAQLGQLDQLLSEAMQGRGHVAALLGEAGAGKTALVEAFLARVGQGAAVFRSACEDLSGPSTIWRAMRNGPCRGRSTTARDSGCRCFQTRSKSSRRGRGQAC
ncbi:AAA family ATPase [Mesorhizobium sp.]|uniref:ATP-binding protein n=1 Tax=Mesorhizobium sp. TaxID=1871066 RepID=UPI00344BA163